MIRIFIADDHEIARSGIRVVVEAAQGIAIVGEAGTAAEVLMKIQNTPVDVLILDVGMPGQSGLEILREVKSLSPKTEILIYTLHSEDEYGLPALRLGAAGYLTKSRPMREIVKAIQTIASGGKYFTPSLTQALVLISGQPEEASAPVKLSRREEQTMRGIARGQPLTEIAKDLGVNPKTVSSYRGRLFEKIKIKTNAALTEHYIKLHPSPKIRQK